MLDGFEVPRSFLMLLRHTAKWAQFACVSWGPDEER